MKLKSQTIDLGLSGYDELFMTEQERADTRKPKVEELPLSELTPFKNHPFKVKNDAEMVELMKSIADAGVLSPALARPKEGGGYELISGHRRLAACKRLDGHHAGDRPHADRRGGRHYDGGQQPAAGAHSAVGKGLRVQDENGGNG